MKIWAIADLHLSFGAPNKNMGVFGPPWDNYSEKIEKNWRSHIGAEDLVLLAGDIAWAPKIEQAMKDLDWIAALPGTKVLLKGNHDHWWPSNKKLAEMLPPSLHFVHNNACTIGEVTIGGSRLWDTEEYSFNKYIHYVANPVAREKTVDHKKDREIFIREITRLRRSLDQLDSRAKYRLAMTHYPPIGADLKDSLVSKILEEYKIETVVFGHLHSVREDSLAFGEKNGVRYLFTAADYLHFVPRLVKG